MTLGSGKSYSTSWTNCSYFVAGKGWLTISTNSVVRYNAIINCGDDGRLALYGWTKDPLVEYYVIENYGQRTPPGNQSLGTLSTDGARYSLHKIERVNQPSIIGTATYNQYYSVRMSKRSSGEITFINHVGTWKSKGWNLGSTWDYAVI